MTDVWGILEGGSARSAKKASNLAAAAFRSWFSVTSGAYLTRVGKTRFCDKSLGSALTAAEFLELMPQAKFLCLYRHGLDFIDSAIEACPWGLSGYGLDSFVTVHPGNNVAAAADYWISMTRQALRFEEAHPDSCLRLRYEDLVSDPEAEAARIFDFLGEEQAPGISRACFDAMPADLGPADHKIWGTRAVKDESVGRGRRVPFRAINAPMRSLADELLGKLGYSTLADYCSDKKVLLGPAAGTQEPERPASQPAATIEEVGELLSKRVSARLPDLGGNEAALGPFQLVVTERGPHGQEWPLRSWRVIPGESRLAAAEVHDPGSTADVGLWGVAGNAESWLSVLTGRVNLGTAIRLGDLRMTDLDDEGTRTVEDGERSAQFGLRQRLLTCILPPGSGSAGGAVAQTAQVAVR